MAMGAGIRAAMPLSPLGSKLPWTCPPFKETKAFAKLFFAASDTPVSIPDLHVVCSQLGFVHAGMQAAVF